MGIKTINDKYLLEAFDEVVESHIKDNSFIKILVFLLYFDSGISYRKLAEILIDTTKKKNDYVSFQKHASDVNEILKELTDKYNLIRQKHENKNSTEHEINKDEETSENISKNDLLIHLLYPNYSELLDRMDSTTIVYSLNININNIGDYDEKE